MKRVILGVLLSVSAVPAVAGLTLCEVITSDISLQKIAWNDVSGEALVLDALGNVHEGRVTLIRDHEGRGKVNIEIIHNPPYYGSDLDEYVVFGTDNGHRVIGASYAVKDGERYMSVSWGNQSAECEVE